MSSTRTDLAGPEEARALRVAITRYELLRRDPEPIRAAAERAVKYPLLAFGVFTHAGRSYWWDTAADSLVRGHVNKRAKAPEDAPAHILHYNARRRGVMPDDEERILWHNCTRGRAG